MLPLNPYFLASCHFLSSTHRETILPNPRSRDDSDPPDPHSTAVDILTNIDIKVSLEALHMWPIVFSRIIQLLGRSYLFFSTLSSAAQK